MERMNRAAFVDASIRLVTLDQLEAFYTAEYPKLIKFLMIIDATLEEAEDAAQKAMTDYVRRSKTAKTPVRNPAAYVQRAAVRFFIKERQRERERLPREIKGCHVTLEARLDDELTAWEDEQYIEHLLECLTQVQREVLKLVMEGLSTREIAEELAKSDENIRQHLKNGRDRLKLHPEIAPLAPKQPQQQSPSQQEVRSTATTPEPRKEEVQ